MIDIFNETLLKFVIFFKVGINQHDVEISTLRLDNVDLSSEDFRAIYSSGKFRRFGQMMFSVNRR